jgi:CubicO group peptidase (beta-lactamase class C family)
MKRDAVPGLILGIINQGKPVYYQHHGLKNNNSKTKIRHDTVFETASISKSVFAYYVMKLVEDKLLDLDTPLSEYLSYPAISHLDGAEKITARMVLSHTSGLPNWRFFNEDGKLNLLSAPGESYTYSGEGFEYLAEVVAHLLKFDHQQLNQHIVDTIFTPLIMEDTSFLLTDELKQRKANAHEEGKVNEDLTIGFKPYFGAAFGLHTTVKGFAPFLVELMNPTLISKATYTAFTTPTTAIPDDDSLNADFGFHSFGLGILVGDTPYGRKYAHGGINPGFQGYYVVIPDAGFGFYYFGNSDTALAMLPDIEACLMQAECEVTEN